MSLITPYKLSNFRDNLGIYCVFLSVDKCGFVIFPSGQCRTNIKQSIVWNLLTEILKCKHNKYSMICNYLFCYGSIQICFIIQHLSIWVTLLTFYRYWNDLIVSNDVLRAKLIIVFSLLLESLFYYKNMVILSISILWLYYVYHIMIIYTYLLIDNTIWINLATNQNQYLIFELTFLQQLTKIIQRPPHCEALKFVKSNPYQ